MENIFSTLPDKIFNRLLKLLACVHMGCYKLWPNSSQSVEALEAAVGYNPNATHDERVQERYKVLRL